MGFSFGGAQAKLVARRLGSIKSAKGFSLLSAASVLFDAVYFPGGEQNVGILKDMATVLHFLNEAYKYCRFLARPDVLRETYFGDTVHSNSSVVVAAGVIAGAANQSVKVASAFVEAITQHRHWSRENEAAVPPDCQPTKLGTEERENHD